MALSLASRSRSRALSLAVASIAALRQSRGSASLALVDPAWSEAVSLSREGGRGTGVGQGSGGREFAPPVRNPPEAIPFAVRALSHVSLAVPDVARAAEHFRTLLGAQVSEILEIPERGMAVSSVHVGSACLVLMQPLPQGGEPNASLAQFLERHPGGGVHHISFTVDNLAGAREHLEAEGMSLVRDAQSGRVVHMGLRHNPVICLDPGSTSGVMCELEQVSFGRSGGGLC